MKPGLRETLSRQNCRSEGVTFGQALNGAGTFSGTLNLRDPRIQNLNPLNGTLPGRTMLAIDVDGSLVWLGIIWTRRYNSATGILTVGGSEVWSYFNYRLQVNDYTSGPLNFTNPGNLWWQQQPEDPQLIAAAIVADAISWPGDTWAPLWV